MHGFGFNSEGGLLQAMNEKCPRGVVNVDAARNAAQGAGNDGGCCVIS